MNKRIYSSAAELKGFSIKSCPSMPAPSGVLMCPPDHYDVSEGRNPYMENSVGRVDKEVARKQWDALSEAFESLGRPVKTIDPVEGLEDMVFTAAPVLTGLTTKMKPICMLGQMCHPARRHEVPHLEKWFSEEGYKIVRPKDPAFKFEGSGDAAWHPGKRLLWGGHGFRSDPEIYEQIADKFETPVLLLKLVNSRFFYLSSCFCPLTNEAVLIYPPAFDPDSLELILKMFPIVLAADQKEAARRLPCCSSMVDSTLIIQKGASLAIRHVEAIGVETLEVDTSEFIKSGASVGTLRVNLY